MDSFLNKACDITKCPSIFFVIFFVSIRANNIWRIKIASHDFVYPSLIQHLSISRIVWLWVSPRGVNAALRLNVDSRASSMPWHIFFKLPACANIALL